MLKVNSIYLAKKYILTAIMTVFLGVFVSNAAIDETMPGSIPTEILNDWKDQGETAEQIKASLPKEFADKCDGSFESACHWRRVYRMKQFPHLKKILFARHHNLGSTAIGFWVNVGSYDVTDQHFEAKGALCLLDFENYYSSYKEILTKNDACVKDPCISLDGKKVAFAMSGKGKSTGYRLFEMEIDNPSSIKQLTENPAGVTVADFEPCYLPNGDIMFSSTRCFGTIDCGWQATSNMFVMDSVGRYMRQVGFDQVHTCSPVLCGNGTVLYCRWEYNDRDIANVMGLFRMNPDGCAQTEVFGNQTTWPMNMIHARAVPGSPNKFFAVASGHHGSYSGEVFVANNATSTNGIENVTMVSPPRKTESLLGNRDTWAMGGVYRNSENPYPLDEEWYLVAYRDEVQESFGSISKKNFQIYLKHIDGKSRELLAWGSGSLHHPVVVAPWEDIWGSKPVSIAEQANYNDSVGILSMQDVYYGAGMEGIDKSSGIAKSIRVVELKYRIAGSCDTDKDLGSVSAFGVPGVVFSAPTLCPVSIYGGSWDAKKVLGEAKIYEDGSASFKVPARKPIYLQVLDSNGCAIASMRSWATLMPGETFSCYGCHENTRVAPPPVGSAMAGQPMPLEKPLGIEDKPFDFKEFVQPILDKHCVSCHGANHSSGLDLRGDLEYDNAAKKYWTKSYKSLMNGITSKKNKSISLATIFSPAEQMKPKSFGSTQSGIITAVLNGHKGVELTKNEIKTLACWVDLEAPFAGTYDSHMTDSDAKKYKDLEKIAQKWWDIEAQNIKEYAATQQVAVNPNNNYRNNEKPVTVAKLSKTMEYLPISRTLVLKNVNHGKIILVDLRGKVVSQFTLSKSNAPGNVTVSLPSTLSKGLYIARFENVNTSEHIKISIVK